MLKNEFPNDLHYVDARAASSSISEVGTSSPPISNRRIPTVKGFSYERGGAAEDAELLAELRAISSSSSIISRFSSSKSGSDVSSSETSAAGLEPLNDKSTARRKSRSTKGKSELVLTPKTEQVSSEIQIINSENMATNSSVTTRVVHESESIVADRDLSKLRHISPPIAKKNATNSKGFRGERGGAAEDAELLAELRAISSSSASASRFRTDAKTSKLSKDHIESKKSDASSVLSEGEIPSETNVPPWKRGKAATKSNGIKTAVSASMDIALKESDVQKGNALTDFSGSLSTDDLRVTMATSVPPCAEAPSRSPPISKRSAITAKSSTGERGGTAEDAELLAELRAISSSSSSASRFRSDTKTSKTPEDHNESKKNDTSSVLSEGEIPSETNVPPWKRGKEATKSSGSKTAVSASMDIALKESDIQKGNALTDFSGPLSTDDLRVTMATSVPPCAEARSRSPPISNRSKGAAKNLADERGGAAEDAELLAELRAISNSSLSASRFRSVAKTSKTSEDHNESKKSDTSSVDHNESKKSDASSVLSEGEIPSETNVPPWKRGKATTKSNGRKTTVSASMDIALKESGIQNGSSSTDELRVTMATSVPLCAEAPSRSPPISKRSVGAAKIFTGERGGTAEDAELLAELRAISSSSSSASRFRTDTKTSKTPEDHDKSKKSDTKTVLSEGEISSETNVPPWKRGNATTRSNGSKTALSASTEIAMEESDIQKENALTDFSGPLSTDELRVKTSSSPPLCAEVQSRSPPILKRSVAAAKSFTGERSGTAEDAELLAELRAISSSSSGASRFGSEAGASTVSHDHSEGERNASLSVDSIDVSRPPWNQRQACTRSGNNSSTEIAVDRSAFPLKKLQSTSDQKSDDFFFMVDLPAPADSISSEHRSASPPISKRSIVNVKSFPGERSGAAEDAELLAELRAISNSSSGAGRFGFVANASTVSDETGIDSERTVPFPNDITGSSSLNTPAPPWKKASIKHVSAASEIIVKKLADKKDNMLTDTSEALLTAELEIPTPLLFESSCTDELCRSPPISKSAVFATKKVPDGMGSAAEASEVLAEIRATSSIASAVTRILNEEPCGVITKGKESFETIVHSDGVIQHEDPLLVGVSSDNIVVDISDLPGSLSSTDWKVRKASYLLLLSRISKECHDSTSGADSNAVMEGLDEYVPVILMDTNAGALDAGLEFANIYADKCSGATSPQQASAIVSALIKGLAFSSSRPSASKFTNSLVIKLMEVGNCGPCSIHAIVPLLLESGLASRKPKVVSTSAALLLETARTFGASMLPLPAVVACLPRMLSSTNVSVRESALNLTVEICRTVGSKDPLKNILSDLKSAQLSQIDKLLESQPSPLPPLLPLRFMESTSLPVTSVLQVLNASAREDDKRRFEARPSVNLIRELAKTDYTSRVKLEKWSEKAGALDTVLLCGGEKPYKLEKPSPSVNYAELLGDLKKLIAHTHYLVTSKAMAVLSMLAEGVGDKLFPQLRSFLPVVLDLTKDKKLTVAAGQCLDSLFGNVLSFDNLLDKDDSVTSAVSEMKQKNALCRTAALEFLKRCLVRREDAGQKGSLTSSSAGKIALLACAKVKDSDPAPRRVAVEILRLLLHSESIEDKSKIKAAIEMLKSSDIRVYKTLVLADETQQNEKSGQKEVECAKGTDAMVPESRQASQQSSGKPTITKAASFSSSKTSLAKNTSGNPLPVQDDMSGQNTETLEESLALLAEAPIPDWNSEEDSGGVLAGLKSNDWKSRKTALENLTSFLEGYTSIPDDSAFRSDIVSSILIVAKKHTKSYKESNINVIKAIMELFLVVSRIHYCKKKQPESGFCRDAVFVAVDKLPDKKLAEISSSLLFSLCEVCPPELILVDAISVIDATKAPLSHESLLVWCADFIKAFGVKASGISISNVASWIAKEFGSSNPKVRKAALALVSELHIQLGPAFKAIVFSSCQESVSSSFKVQIEDCLDRSPFDPKASSRIRPKKCVTLNSTNFQEIQGSACLDISKVDLMSSLPGDILSRMCIKEGKNAWKLRKEAMEEVSSSLDRCGGVISCAPNCVPGLVELVRALTQRLNDIQSNLKPLAASLIETIFYSVDSDVQVKLGRIAFPPLLSAAMADNRQAMRDKSMSALKAGTRKIKLDEVVPNSASLEILLGSFVTITKDSEFKAIGLPDLLHFLSESAAFLPKISQGTAISKPQTLELHFAHQLVACLASSRAEARHAAENLLRCCVQFQVLSSASILSGVEQLLPAQQRGVRPIVLHAIAKSSPRVAEFDNHSLTTATSSKSNSDKEKAKSPQKSVICQVPKIPVMETSTRESVSQLGLETIEPSQHPFVHSLAGHKPTGKDERISARKRENWPDYPETPSGKEYFLLRKQFFCFLPPRSGVLLFPHVPFAKQDDALQGIEIIFEAVRLEQSSVDTHVLIDVLDLVLKWIAVVLCSRESTTGMQAILSLIISLFQFLQTRDYTLNDFEAAILLPHLFDKGSAAKGRFREMLKEVIRLSMKIYQPQKFGTLVCVPVMERSSNAKARVLAMSECRICVELVGTSAISKRGMQHLCKTLSDEALIENRVAALDLAEEIIRKLNGDTNRFYIACGNSLSSKAMDMIEERWAKRNSFVVECNDCQPKTTISQEHLRVAQIPKKIQTNKPQFISREESSPTIPLRLNNSDELRGSDAESFKTEEGPFMFKYTSSRMNDYATADISSKERDDHLTSRGFASSSLFDEETRSESQNLHYTINLGGKEGSLEGNAASKISASAASLRARLKKIRDRTSLDPNHPPAALENMQTFPVESKLSAKPTFGKADKETLTYQGLCEKIDAIFSLSPPISSCSPEVSFAINTIEKLQFLIGNGGNDILEDVKSDVSVIVPRLTSVIDFSFRCGDPADNAGIIVALLMAAVTTLTAIFRDSEIVQHISSSALQILIKQVSVGLLDSRLTSGGPDRYGALDVESSTQLVKALNRLAIQAAIGSPRQTSLQALMFLQIEYSSPVDHFPPFENSATSTRLARVSSKLFTRVIKSEESSSSAFGPHICNESLLHSVERFLTSISDLKRHSSLEGDNLAELPKMLLTAFISVRGVSSETDLRKLMASAGIDWNKSRLGGLIQKCLSNAGYSTASNLELRSFQSIGGASQFLGENTSSVRPPTVTSERIRALRAKLQATDSSAQVDFDCDPKTQIAVPVLSTTDGSSRAALVAIRERLAAAHENKVSATTSNCSPEPLEAKEIVAGSRSSALRSRLEAMKKRHPN